MDYLQRFRDLFLYAGAGKEEYERLLPSIRRENQELLSVFSQIAGVMLFALYFVSVFSGGFTSVNVPVYLLSGIEMVFIMLCAHFVLPNHPRLVTPIVYVFEILLYVFGIHISMLHSDKPAVSAVAFLLVSPLLFYDRPVRISAMIAAVVTLFCGMVVCFKDPDVAVNDVWNMITFGIVAVATTIFTMSIKMRSLSQARQIEYLSQTDLLTLTKNRNHYESRLADYAVMGTQSLMCVYADVNGLHETNNELGHPTGDKMLQDVAARIRETFGDEDTYRTGGDEFVAFVVDEDAEEVARQVEAMRADLEAQGYNVSFGMARREREADPYDMAGIVGEAEANMFASKLEFYESAEHDRRAR